MWNNSRDLVIAWEVIIIMTLLVVIVRVTVDLF